MKEYSFTPQGTCSSQIDFSIDDNGKLHNVVFHGGCPGNTKAVAKLLEGYDAKAAVDLLKGNPCGTRGTSCADQLARGVEKALGQ
ncbi:MAG: TIGR03905 family TSCPD domain-containing protein [Lachnospiraceae bacterium]|uniref:ribonucleoside-diphosphate reductase n=1 Tax=Candidatus Weimeria bifida TaxID=2599074 RepID=A0A6N7J047_9FIRM|nr:TIGR03905 family TSCPD domain-containing protein [Candidatus Weimeria bifida]RRF96636.1 MAG: TIGR03905 family TSCPD domain-containing protein [Lachnospiraceae bacterium]